MEFTLRHSRLKNLLVFFGMSIFVYGFFLLLGGVLISRSDMSAFVFGLATLFLASVLFFCFVGWLIALKRVLLAPVVVRIDETGVHYHYSVFHKKNKVMFIPWDKVHDFSFDSLSVPRRVELLGASVPVSSQVGYLRLFVEAGYLSQYGMWRHNLFIGHKKTGTSLAIICDYFQAFDSEAIYTFAYEKITSSQEQ